MGVVDNRPGSIATPEHTAHFGDTRKISLHQFADLHFVVAASSTEHLPTQKGSAIRTVVG